MMMPGREYQAQPSRFGFNGKENDNEAKGFGNQQDYGMRIYDSRLGKFLSVDPLQTLYSFYSPYHFSGNSPIRFVDLDGLEPEDFMRYWVESKEIATRYGYSVRNVYDNVTKQTWSVMQYPNSNSVYYWKPFDGTTGTFGEKALKDRNGNWTGYWQRFETADDRLRKDRSLDLFFAGIIVGVPAFVEASFVAGAYAGPTFWRLFFWGAKNSPLLIAGGNLSVGFLDPTGQVDLPGGIDDLGRGLRLLIKSDAVERFIINTSKFDYFFGRVASSEENLRRSLQNLKDLEKLGIEESKGGREQLLKLFNDALSSEEIKRVSNDFGVTVTKKVLAPKGNGHLEVGFFYKDGNMNATPVITTVIPKIHD